MSQLSSITTGERPDSPASRIQSVLRSFGPFRFAGVVARGSSGTVTLSGAVPSYFAKALAFQLAQGTATDQCIIDALRVQPPPPPLRRSDDIGGEPVDRLRLRSNAAVHEGLGSAS